MLSPEGPTGRAIGQAVLDDQSDGSVDDAACVVAAGFGEVGHVGIEVLAAARAIMLRVDQDDVAGSASEGVAQVVEGAAGEAVAVGAVAAAWAASPAVIAALADDLGLGQIVDEHDIARILVRREPFLHKRLQFIGQQVGRGDMLLERDICACLDQAIVIDPDDCRFEHRVMLDQHHFDFNRRNILPAHLQHVVAAARIDVAAVWQPAVLVAAAKPFAEERCPRFLAIAPVHQRRARPFDVEITDLTVGHRLAGFVAQFDRITGHRRTGSAVFDVADTIR